MKRRGRERAVLETALSWDPCSYALLFLFLKRDTHATKCFPQLNSLIQEQPVYRTALVVHVPPLQLRPAAFFMKSVHASTASGRS